MKLHLRHILILAIVVVSSCNDKEKQVQGDKRSVDSQAQLELADSSKLTHIKGEFYKSQSGQLFERTFADRHVKGIDKLVSVEYFNGVLPQDIDPLTFVPLNGWFAKDKQFAYFYHPTAGGIEISKLEKADVKTFSVIEGEYEYAVDKNYVFKETEILDNLNPANLKIIKDKDGEIIKLISGKTVYDAK